MAIGYRGWDRKYYELRGRRAAMSPWGTKPPRM